jgi:sialic acid synthase SpsE
MELSRLPVGYSDHTPSVETGARAVRHGASLLEKHLTYSQDAAGPDHAASLEPPMLRMYIELANEAFERRGSEPVPVERKQLLDIERDVREASRQSLVATRSLRVGHVIRREDLTVKRPGAGIPAKDLDRVVGLTLNEDVPKSLLEAPMASAV